jgi:hypothetical protein
VVNPKDRKLMCLNNNKPAKPSVQKITAPPPIQPLQIAQTSRIQQREVEPDKKKPVAYGAKTLRDKNTVPKRDAASLLVPLNIGSSEGGINT